MSSLATALKKVRGNRSASRGRMTTAPPAKRVGNSVPKDPSKWKGETHSVRVASSRPRAATVATTAAEKAALPMSTPLGAPVVPEV